MNISAKTKICTIIGDPIIHSFSPVKHNAAYKALGMEGEYIFIATRITKKNLEKFMSIARDIGFREITVTMPHKIAVMDYLDEIDTVAQKIGAVNTIINTNGMLKGFNTDWFGIAEPLKKIINLKNKKVAILGAGGASRAAIYACIKYKARVKIFNRTLERAVMLAKDFGCDSGSLQDIEEIKNMDVIINTTSVGFENQKSLVSKKFFSSRQIVFDVIPSIHVTRFLQDAKEKGAKIIEGREMGIYQAVMQFELYTGKKAPIEVMRKATE